MANYFIKEVINNKQQKEFNILLTKIYKGDKNWVRPLDSDINIVFDKSKNLMFNNGEAVRWLLYNEKGLAVGRIAAFYNRGIADKDTQPTGGCGFFECINDQQAANILFDNAKMWLQSKGMEAMDGPINFGSRELWWGLLTDNFSTPVYGMSYNPQYYKELFENYGFKEYYNQFSFYRDFRIDTMNPVVTQKAQRLRENPEYEFKHVKKSELDSLTEDFRYIYNKAWSKFTGVDEMSEQDVKNLLKKLRPIIDERLIYFAYHNNKAIGFFIMVPDINGAIKHLNGKSNLWSMLKLIYHLNIRKSCNIIEALIFAVVPEFQGKGIESGMIDCFKNEINSKPTHYKYMELVWVGDFNPLMVRMVETYVGARKYKTHTTYRYLFDREKEFKRAPRVSMARQ